MTACTFQMKGTGRIPLMTIAQVLKKSLSLSDLPSHHSVLEVYPSDVSTYRIGIQPILVRRVLIHVCTNDTSLFQTPRIICRQETDTG